MHPEFQGEGENLILIGSIITGVCVSARVGTRVVVRRGRKYEKAGTRERKGGACGQG